MINSYALQYTNVDVTEVLTSGVDTFITEGGTGAGFTGAALTPTDRVTLQTAGTQVLAYVNVAVTDDNRDYWDPAWTDDGTDTGTVLGTAPAWLQGQPSNSFGYIADFNNTDWKQIVVDQAVAYVTAGYDGVFLDDVAQYFVSGATPLTIAQQADLMMELVVLVANAIRAVNPAAQVIVNSSPYIVTDSAFGSGGIPALVFGAAVDAMVFESYFGINGSEEAAIAHAQTYIAPNMQLLALEYGGSEFQNWAFYGTAMAQGFIPFAAGDASYSGFGSVSGPTPGDDTVTGLNISQQLYLLAGDDSLTTGAGDDTLLGNSGNDTIRAGDGADIILGGTGDDSLYGDAGQDILRGDDGADYLYGGDDGDRLLGGLGMDTVYGQNGDDIIFLGDGDDYTDAGYGHDTVFGGDGNDSMRGWYGNDVMLGEAGNDTVQGDYGNDTLVGGVGDDVLNGRDDNDRLLGGADNDTLNGGADHDMLRGGTGLDSLLGSYGNDTLFGDDGNDVLLGEGTGDYYVYATDHDVLLGGAGDDTLNGGVGDDTLVGGAGADHFQFDDEAGHNVIRDFEFGTDTWALDDAMWSYAGTLSAQEVLDYYGRFNLAGDVLLLSVGNTHIALLGTDGLSRADIADDILIY